MSETSTAKPTVANYGIVDDVQHGSDEIVEHSGVQDDDDQPKRSPFRIYTTFAALCVSAFGNQSFPPDCTTCFPSLT